MILEIALLALAYAFASYVIYYIAKSRILKTLDFSNKIIICIIFAVALGIPILAYLGIV
jgi:hypothetical protein